MVTKMANYKAILYFDTNKKVWRVRKQDARPNEKGSFVPSGIRERFKDSDNNKNVTVIQTDGNIAQVLFEGEKAQNVPHEHTGARQQAIPVRGTQRHAVVEIQNSPILASSLQAEDLDNSKKLEIFAYACAENAKGIGAEYKGHAKSLPMMIRANGLGATLTYLKSKDKDKSFVRLYSDLGRYLQTKSTKLTTPLNVADDILDCDSHETKELTKEAVRFLSWLRRFSEGLIEDKK